MENHFLLTDDLLWDYADDLLGADERKQVEAYLAQHPAQRERLEAILAEKRVFSHLKLEKPQKGFADRVMAAWVAEHALSPVRAEKPDWILSSIAGAFGLFLLAMLALILIMAPSAPISLPSSYLPEMPGIDWLSVFGNPALRYGGMLLLAFLGLQMMDRYLRQKARLAYGKG